MSGKYLTVIAGCVLLIGCLLGISVLIFGPMSEDNNSSTRDSIHHHAVDHSTFNDWKIKKSSSGNIIQKSRRNNDSSLTDKYQILFSKSNNLTQREITTQQNKFIPPNLVLPNKRFNNGSSRANFQSSSSIESAASKVNEKYRQAAAENIPPPINNDQTDKSIPMTISTTEKEEGEFLAVASPDHPIEGSDLTSEIASSSTYDDSQDDGLLQTSSDEMGQVLEANNKEHNSNEDHFTSQEQYEEQEEPGGSSSGSPFLDFTDLLERLTNLYSSGLPNLSRFFQFLNETVNKENTSGLLTQLNNLYSRPQIISSSLGSDMFSGRNTYESSLAAFVFMSFGVFLLNQIHNLIGKDKFQGRAFGQNYDNFLTEDSELDLLFQPPPFASQDNNNNNSTTIISDSEINESNDDYGIEMMRMINNDNKSANNLSSSLTSSPAYMNNMFRAFLNLINAYTKDPQALECIWSLYCEDLDKTSAKDGLYGIAARINSIGLRLIMHQISSELTLDVMLRSLLGWDGLPCKKMFPVCQVNNASMTLTKSTTSEELASSSTIIHDLDSTQLT